VEPNISITLINELKGTHDNDDDNNYHDNGSVCRVKYKCVYM